MRAVKEFRLSDDTEVFIYDDRTIEIVQEGEYEDRVDIVDMTYDELYELFGQLDFRDAE